MKSSGASRDISFAVWGFAWSRYRFTADPRQVRPGAAVAPQSTMNENRNLRVREYLDSFATEDDRRNTAASVRGHYNEVTAFRLCGINDRLIQMSCST